MDFKSTYYSAGLLFGRERTFKKAIGLAVIASFLISIQTSFGNQIKLLQAPVLQAGIKIQVKFNEAKPSDTLVLTILNLMMPFKDKEERTTINNDGEFNFEITTGQQCGYLKIGKIDHNLDAIASGNIRDLTIPFFWENGDDVKLTLFNKETQAGISSKYLFTGMGANKYNVRAEAFDDSLYKNQSLVNTDKAVFDDKMHYNSSQKYFDRFRLEAIEKERNNISALSFNTLKADVLYQYGAAMYYDILKFYQTSFLSLTRSKKDSILNLYRINFGNVINEGVPEDVLEESLNAVSYLNYKFRANSYICNGNVDLVNVYNQLKVKTAGKLRDRLILYYLKFSRNSPAVDSIFEDSKSIVMAPLAKKELKELEPLFSKMNEIKDYKFYDKNDQPVTLGRFKDKVILIDFWSTGCGPCASFYQNTLSKVEHYFAGDKGIAIISVCLDISRERWLKSVKSGLYTSEAAMNVYTGGTGVKHAITDDYNIRIYPVVMLVNSKGKVVNFNTENLYKMPTLIDAMTVSK